MASALGEEIGRTSLPVDNRIEWHVADVAHGNIAREETPEDLLPGGVLQDGKWFDQIQVFLDGVRKNIVVIGRGALGPDASAGHSFFYRWFGKHYYGLVPITPGKFFKSWQEQGAAGEADPGVVHVSKYFYVLGKAPLKEGSSISKGSNMSWSCGGAEKSVLQGVIDTAHFLCRVVLWFSGGLLY